MLCSSAVLAQSAAMMKALVRKLFFQFGLHVAARPCVLLCYSLVGVGFMLAGIGQVRERDKEDTEHTKTFPWSKPEATKVTKAKEITGQLSRYDKCQVMFSTSDGSNLLEEQNFRAARSIHETILYGAFSVNSKMHSFQDVCVRKTNGKCGHSCPLDAANVVRLFDGSRGFRNTSTHMLPVFVPVEQDVPVEHDAVHYEASAAVTCTYSTTDTDFHLALAEHVRHIRGRDGIQVSAGGDIIFSDGLSRAGLSTGPLLVTTLVLMLVLLTVHLFEECSKRFVLRQAAGFVICATIIFSISSAVGVVGWLSYSGAKISNVAFLGVFLAFGMGVDDMMVLIRTYDARVEEKCTKAVRVASALAEAGPAIFFTSVTSFAAYGMGVVSDIQHLRDFSIFAGSTVATDFILELTFFFPLFVIMDNRSFSLSTSTSTHQVEEGRMTRKKKVWVNSISACLVDPKKRAISSAILAFIFFALAQGIFKQNFGYRIENNFLKDSPGRRFMQDITEQMGDLYPLPASIDMRMPVLPQPDVVLGVREMVSTISEALGLRAYVKSKSVFSMAELWGQIHAPLEIVKLRTNSTSFGQFVQKDLLGRHLLNITERTGVLLRNNAETLEFERQQFNASMAVANATADAFGSTGNALLDDVVAALLPISAQLNATRWLYRNVSKNRAGLLAEVVSSMADGMAQAAKSHNKSQAAAALRSFGVDTFMGQLAADVVPSVEMVAFDSGLDAVESILRAASAFRALESFANKTIDAATASLQMIAHEMAQSWGSVYPENKRDLPEQFSSRPPWRLTKSRRDWFRHQADAVIPLSARAVGNETFNEFEFTANELENVAVELRRIKDTTAAFQAELPRLFVALNASLEGAASILEKDGMSSLADAQQLQLLAGCEALREAAGQLSAERGIASVETFDETTPWTPGADGVISLQEVAHRALARGLAAGVAAQRYVVFHETFVNTSDFQFADMLQTVAGQAVRFETFPELLHNASRKSLHESWFGLAGARQNILRRRGIERDAAADARFLHAMNMTRKGLWADRFWAQEQRTFEEDFGANAEAWVLIDWLLETRAAVSSSDFGGMIKGNMNAYLARPTPTMARLANRREDSDMCFANSEAAQEETEEEFERDRVRRHRGRWISEEVWTRNLSPFENRQALLDAFDANDRMAERIDRAENIEATSGTAMAGESSVPQFSRGRETSDAPKGGLLDVCATNPGQRWSHAAEHASLLDTVAAQKEAAEDTRDEQWLQNRRHSAKHDMQKRMMEWALNFAENSSVPDTVINLTSKAAQLQLSFLGETRSFLDATESLLRRLHEDLNATNWTRSSLLFRRMSGNITNAILPRMLESVNEQRGLASQMLESSGETRNWVHSADRDFVINPAGSRDRRLPCVNYSLIDVSGTENWFDGPGLDRRATRMRQIRERQYIITGLDTLTEFTNLTNILDGVTMQDFLLPNTLVESLLAAFCEMEQNSEPLVYIYLAQMIGMIWVLCFILMTKTVAVVLGVGIVLLYLQVVGFVGLIGQSLEFTTLIVLLVIVGTLIDYCSHAIHCVEVALEIGLRNREAHRFCLNNSFQFTCEAGTTTVIAMLPLLAAEMLATQVFAVNFLVSVLLSWLWAVFVVPTLGYLLKG